MNNDKQIRKKKILIADDDESARISGQLILENEGYEVITAVNGSEAVDKFKAETPDIILMDIVMPEMNGLDACRKIKNINSETAVIILSGKINEVEKGFDYGADDCIAKPINWDRLLEEIISFTKNKK